MSFDERAKAVVAAMTGERLSLRQVRERIADAIRAAVLEERERCARVVERDASPAPEGAVVADVRAYNLAAAIRAG